MSVLGRLRAAAGWLKAVGCSLAAAPCCAARIDASWLALCRPLRPATCPPAAAAARIAARRRRASRR